MLIFDLIIYSLYLIGCPYAALFGSQWSRVLIEKVQRYAEVFYVDIGHRQALRQSMMFFNLPQRFMTIHHFLIPISLLKFFSNADFWSYQHKLFAAL